MVMADRNQGGGERLMIRLEDLVYRWQRALMRQELAPRTVKTYGWALRDFCRFLAICGIDQVDQLDREAIEDWQDNLRTRLSRSSRSMASVAVRQFLRWGVGQGPVDPHAPYWVTRIKGQRHRPRPIAPDDLRIVLGYLTDQQFAGTVVDLRDRALFLYILSTGARASEAIQVKRADVKRAIIIQKGGEDKDLEATVSVLQAVREYLDERDDLNPWLWVTLDSNHPMRPLAPAGIREVWRRMAARLELTPWTTHQLRHTGATELYEAGIDVMVIADWLGHKGLGHVPQYARVSWRRRQEALAVLQRLIENNGSRTAAPVPLITSARGQSERSPR